MIVKIDTKEKFTVIAPEEAVLSANMAEEFTDLLKGRMAEAVPHVVLNMETVQHIDKILAARIAEIQQEFYENNLSFVVCCLSSAVEEEFDRPGFLETMNVTPTESEAWDIIQMEEIERELLDDNFDN